MLTDVVLVVQGVYKSPDAATKDFIFQQTMMRIKACLKPQEPSPKPTKQLPSAP